MNKELKPVRCGCGREDLTSFRGNVPVLLWNVLRQKDQHIPSQD